MKVIGSTFLGGEEFIQRVMKEYLEGRRIDIRNIPSVRRVLRGATPGEIDKVVEKVIGKDHPLYRKICVYLSHQLIGLSLEEVGAYFGMKGAAVSQLNRRFREVLDEDKGLKKILEGIEKKLLNVGT